MDEIGVSVQTQREEEIAGTMDFFEGADEVNTGVRRGSCKDRQGRRNSRRGDGKKRHGGRKS